MSKNIEKAREMTDVKISFVSLVDRAANKRTFLIQKAEDGQAQFTTYGRIIKAEDEGESHYVTGVVYEPMTEDFHGDFMTEEEIIKTAHWFMKNAGRNDVQHSFVPMEGVTPVESWVAKSDFDIDGETVKKGTWLMTAEITNADVWEAVQKGELTGFSMGGYGNYSEEDIELDEITKQAENGEKVGFLEKVAKALGLKAVVKGEVAEIYEERSTGARFWEAFNALETALRKWDWVADKYRYEDDESKIEEALNDFSAIITEVLTGKQPIAKAIVPQEGEAVEKSGRELSKKNLDALRGIKDSLDSFLKAFDPDDEDEEKETEPTDPDEKDDDKEKEEEVEKSQSKEGNEMTKQEVEEVVKAALAEALAKSDDTQTQAEQTPDPVEKQEQQETITKADVEQMVADAVQKALEPVLKDEGQADPEPEPVEKQEDGLTKEAVEQMIGESVAKAVEPILKARGVPSNLDGDTKTVEKAERHYLAGVL